MIIKVYDRPEGLYKTGHFQSSNQRWWGIIPKGKKEMEFITSIQFEEGIRKKEENTQPPDILPFPF